MTPEPRGFGARGDLAFACLKPRCYSPIACGGFGYCREINFEGPVLMFPAFGRFAAVRLGLAVLGYMVHEKDGTHLHLAQDASAWICEVRRAGPYASHEACQDAIRAKLKQVKLL